MGKIKTLPSLKKIVSQAKKQGKCLVFTNGCFDLLHPGHLKVLGTAKQKGDLLIVGLNSDSSVKKIKGPGRPVFNEKVRAQILESVGIVDYVILFKEKTPYNLIKQLRPHILVKGGDWTENEIVGREFVDKVCRVKIHPGHSTSKLIEKIIKTNKHKA